MGVVNQCCRCGKFAKYEDMYENYIPLNEFGPEVSEWGHQKPCEEYRKKVDIVNEDHLSRY